MGFNGMRLLVLGGAIQCKKYIEAAKEMGVFCIVTDLSQNSPCKLVADQSLDYSVTDYESLLNWCKENPVDGVINFCIDYAQHTHQRLCEALNLPCYGNKYQFECLTDKLAFKDMCRNNNVDVIKEYDIENPEAIEYPVVVKPAESSGSRGNSVCNNKSELEIAYRVAKDESRNERVIIEKCMSGCPEFSMTYLFIDGEANLIRTVDRFLGKKEDGLDRQCICSSCPSKYTDLFLKNVNERVISMLKNIGIKNGPVFMQGFVDGDTIRFYDPGFRFAGGEYEKLLYCATGVSIMKFIVEFALTGKMSVLQDELKNIYLLNGKRSLQLCIDSREGTIKTYEGFDELAKRNEIKIVSKKAKVGSMIPNSGDVKQRIAEIGVVAENKPEVISSLIDEIYATLRVEDENGNDMIISKQDPSKV